MQLEKLATPFSGDSPHRRYAALHRAMESGVASDATWRELAEVCLRLGHHDEALTACGKIRDRHLRRDVETMLVRRGLLQRHEVHPDAADAPLERGLKDDVLDALRGLFEDHMPLTTVVTTLTFPVVVGLGGFLTSATSSFVFPMIAALPALCVAAIVAGLGRRILIDSARGIQEPPRIPELRELRRQSLRFVLDAVVLALVFLGPAIVLMAVQGPFLSTILAAAVGAFLLPGAFAIRQLTEDWRALSPNYLFAAVTRLRGEYAATASICGLVALPAALAAYFTTGSQLYLQASVVGPLAVAPLFFATRLLGLTVHANRHDLRDILAPKTAKPSMLTSTPSAQRAPAASADALQPNGATRGVASPRARVQGEPAAQSRLGTSSHEPPRPVLRTTSATPPKVHAVEPRPAPEVGPLPSKPTRTTPPNHPLPREPQTARASAPPPSQKAPTMREPNPMPAITARRVRAMESAPPAPVAHMPAERQSAARPAGRHKAVRQPGAAPTSSSAPSSAASAAAQDAECGPRTKVEIGEAPPDYTQLPGFNVVTGQARLLAGASSQAKRRS